MPKLKGKRWVTVMEITLACRKSYLQLTLVIVCFLECCNLGVEARKYCDASSTAVTKSHDKTCDKEFIFCVPGLGGIPAKCPEHLVYNPKRENCDIPKSCGGTHEIDRQCIGKPCGLHADPGCETYYICSGGNRIRKKCPTGYFFDTEDLDCQDPTVEEVVCFDDVISKPLEPTDIQPDTSFSLSDTDDPITPVDAGKPKSPGDGKCPDGSKCPADGKCPDGTRCLCPDGSKCPPDNGKCPDGSRCSDVRCPDGSSCPADGICPDRSRCKCPDGSRCPVDGRCRDGSWCPEVRCPDGSKCPDNGKCPDGSKCRCPDGSKCPAADLKCPDSSLCPEIRCLDGSKCPADGICPDRSRCKCPDGSRCPGDGRCPDGSWCPEVRCPDGSKCPENGKCPDGSRCRCPDGSKCPAADGICPDKSRCPGDCPDGSKCPYHGKCPDGTRCRGDCPDGSKCSPEGKCQDGSRCRGHGDCPDGSKCPSDGKCPDGSKCRGTGDCPDGSKCPDNGICPDKSRCTPEVKCQDGTVCPADGICPDKSKCRCPDGSKCPADGRCPDGSRCPEYKCLDNTRCPIDGRCPDGGKCICPDGTRCPADGICPDRSSCRGRGKFCPPHTFKAPPDAPVSPTKDGIVLELPKVTDWGKWNDWESCPKGTYATAMSVWKRSIEDDTGTYDHGGVVSIGFKCEDPLQMKKPVKGDPKVIGQYAKDSPDNKWYAWLECDEGMAVGVQLSQQDDQGPKDDTATDNVKMICSCGPEKEKFKPYHIKKPAYNKVGNQRGAWTEAKYCNKRQAICGIKTQMQDWRQTNFIKIEKEDMTGMNQMHVKCCDVPSPAAMCTARETLQYIQRCDNSLASSPRPCQARVLVGTAYNKKHYQHTISFYTSLGFTLSESIPNLKASVDADVQCDSGECEINYQKLDGSRIYRIAQYEYGEVKVQPFVNAKIHQVIIECGMFKIYTNTLVTMGKKKDGSWAEDQSFVI